MLFASWRKVRPTSSNGYQQMDTTNKGPTHQLFIWEDETDLDNI